MRGIVHSVLESDSRIAAARVGAVRDDGAWVEIRADALATGDLPGLVAGARHRPIVAVRRAAEGGSFEGSEEARIARLRAALDAGAVVDVEWGSAAERLAESEDPDRVILSHHGGPCRGPELEMLYRAMAGSRAGRLKIVPRAERLADGSAVRDLLALAAKDRRELACFATGSAGTPTRIFALAWGSWATYGAAAAGRRTGEGQLAAADLTRVYRVERLGAATRRFALAGTPIGSSPSPAMHAVAYAAAGIEGVYLPLETDRIEDLEPLVGRDGLYGVEAFGVTIPLKREAFGRCGSTDPQAAWAGAVNTVRVEGSGWRGSNTDAEALRRIVRRAGAPPLRIAILGAGGAARAAASLVAEGDAVTLYARDAARAATAGRAIGAASLPIDRLGTEGWDVLVQATPLGRRGEEALPGVPLRGRLVVDLAYGPLDTPLVRASTAAGIETIDGVRFLAEQAALQFERMTGASADVGTMEAAARCWLRTGDPDAA